MSRRLRRFAIVPGLALAVALVGGLLFFVGASPASASTLSFTTVLTQTVATDFSVTVNSATAGQSVTLALTTAPTGSTLGCASNPVTATGGGVASFTNCVINDPSTGSGDVLEATDAVDSPSSSNSFVVLGPASRLVFTQQPLNTTVSTAFNVGVSEEDVNGNVVTTDSALTVQLTLTTGSGLGGCTGAVTFSAGVASFTGCMVGSTGTADQLTATRVTGGTLSALSASFNVAGTAYQIGFTGQPSATAVAEVAFSTEPIVSVEDSSNRVVTADNSGSISLSLTANTYGGILTCTTYTEPISSGTANFASAGCRINKSGIYTLTATTTGLVLNTATSSTITIGAAQATHLVFNTEPSATATDRTVFATQPVVAIEDGYGNIATANYSDVVTLTLTTTNGATLTCATSAAIAVAGVATFAGCDINNMGTYTLTATDTTEPAVVSAAVSSGIVVGVGAPHKLVFTTEPRAAAQAGTVFGRRPVVAIEDAVGNVVKTNSSDVVTLSLRSAHGAALTCASTTRTASAGVAPFASCRINKSGTYRLTATDTTEPSVVTVAVSSRIVVRVGPPHKLVFTTEPSAAAKAGTVLATQPVVAIEDAAGNVVTTNSNDVVTLSLTTANGAALTCTPDARTASAGVATFAGCRINKPGTFTLTASSSGLDSAVSATVSVASGTPAGAPKEVPNEIVTVHPSGIVKFGSSIQLRIHFYDGLGTVSGNITVNFEGETLCSDTLANGVANCTLSSSKIGHGGHTLVVTYAGQGSYYSRNGAVLITMT